MSDYTQIIQSSSHRFPVLTVMETTYEEWANPLLKPKRHLNEKRSWVNHVGTQELYGNTLCVDEQLIQRYFLHQEKVHKKHKKKLLVHIPLSG